MSKLIWTYDHCVPYIGERETKMYEEAFLRDVKNRLKECIDNLTLEEMCDIDFDGYKKHIVCRVLFGTGNYGEK